MIRTEHRGGRWPFQFVKYEPSERMENPPIIIQLHGAGERGDELSRVDIHGFSKIMDGEFPAIFIMPQCPENSFWAARVESIIRFVEMAIEEFGADRDRVYLTGLSMGGFGTWYTAMARPDLFAAIVPVCGGGMPWNVGVLTMPVWAFHGADDTTVLPSNSDDMVNALRGLGRDVRYTRMDGVGHNVWEHAYNAELVAWLLDKKKG